MDNDTLSSSEEGDFQDKENVSDDADRSPSKKSRASSDTASLSAVNENMEDSRSESDASQDDVSGTEPGSLDDAHSASGKHSASINIELSDEEREMDEGEWMNYSWGDLAKHIDFRSEDEISVSDQKDYLEVLEEKLEAREAKQKRRRSRKKRHAHTCYCALCAKTFKRGGGSSGGRGGGSGSHALC